MIQVAILAIYIFISDHIPATMFIVLFFLVFEAALLFYVISIYERELKKNIVDVSEILGEESKDAFVIGGLGLVVYDNSYNIVWMNDYFTHIEINRVSEKITTCSPNSFPQSGEGERIRLYCHKDSVTHKTLDARECGD